MGEGVLPYQSHHHLLLFLHSFPLGSVPHWEQLGIGNVSLARQCFPCATQGHQLSGCLHVSACLYMHQAALACHQWSPWARAPWP